jgi:hypothetical protein
VKIRPQKNTGYKLGNDKRMFFLYKNIILIQVKARFVQKKKKVHNGRFEKKYLPYKTYLP